MHRVVEVGAASVGSLPMTGSTETATSRVWYGSRWSRKTAVASAPSTSMRPGSMPKRILVIRWTWSRPSCTNSIAEPFTVGGIDPPEWRWVMPRTSKMSAKSAPNVSPTSRVTSKGL